jgi:hypothetical protein
MQNLFRLDELLARDVVPQWFEGVAIVQLVCRQLRAQGRESAFPHPQGILIAIGGSVTTVGGSDGQPVQAAAHLLGLMLGNDAPVRLRLAVSQATASDGGFTSLTALSEALAYFERPNPEGLVEEFRQRALLARPREVAPAMRVDSTPAPAKQAATTEQAQRRRVSLVPVALATVAVLAGAALWVNRHSLSALLMPQVGASETEEITAPSAKSSPKTGAAVAPIAHHDNAVSATSRQLRPIVGAETSVLPAAPQLQVVATTLSYRYPVSLLPETVAAFPLTAANVAIVGDVWSPAPEPADRIYSQADPQVTRPLSVYPRFPNNPPGASAVGATTLELTIAADGLVERVKMLTTPRNIHEFMLLSAAKAWRFEPARIDGRAVRFRQLMTLTAMP